MNVLESNNGLFPVGASDVRAGTDLVLHVCGHEETFPIRQLSWRAAVLPFLPRLRISEYRILWMKVSPFCPTTKCCFLPTRLPAYSVFIKRTRTAFAHLLNCTQSLSFLVHSNWKTGASEKHTPTPRGHLLCSLQSRARSCILLAPVSQLLREKKGTACSLRTCPLSQQVYFLPRPENWAVWTASSASRTSHMFRLQHNQINETL